MATRQTSTLARFMMAPSVILLLVWMIVPLAVTLWFSFLQYNPLNPIRDGFIGFSNYALFFKNPAFAASIVNTLVLVLAVLAITIVGGILLALLLDQPMHGQGLVRVLMVSPFFVMPTVSALVWKNMFMNPVNGLFAWLAGVFGVPAIDWLADAPLLSLVIIVSWGWLPFATLILLTALQSLDHEQREAAEMDGAGALQRFVYITLPHLRRAVTVVILIQTIFLLAIFAEIFVTTNGGPGSDSTNLAYLVYSQALLRFDVGSASAGGVIAVLLANVLAFFLMRIVGRTLEA